MPPPRRARRFAGFLLVWFALFLGAAALSPALAQESLGDVCSASAGAAAPGAGHGKAAGPHALKCPLCLFAHAALPPPAAAPGGVKAQALGHVLLPMAAARVAALTGAPLPARGPPSVIST